MDTSVKLIAEEISRFLKTSEPETICIMGKWGVGKTFAWNQFLRDAVTSNAVGLKKYSYVSLFGQNSLEGLKYSIFENTVDIDHINSGPDLGTLSGSLSSIQKLSRPILGVVGSILGKDYFSTIARGFFLTVRDEIICIDDLDRVGKGLEDKDVLGIISYLKEQRRCKVVLLLNNEELQSKNDFKDHLEKVIDVEMKFEPTAFEASAIGIDKTNSFYKKFAQTTTALNIVNIRVIRKIQRLIKRLEELLAYHDKRIFEGAIPSMVLFGWVTYQPKLAPSIDFVKKFLRMGDLIGSKKETDQEKSWRALINGIDYSHFDEFDQLLLDSIQRGYFDPMTIKKVATELDKKFVLQDKDNSFNASWEKYHGSFSCNQDEVLDDMFEAFKKGVESISPTNLDGAVSLFRELGRDTQADEMVVYYMSERNEKREFYDPQYSMFLNLRDPAIIKAFSDKLATFRDVRTPKEILIHIAKSSGWNPEDILKLSQVTADQYYELFKKTEGTDLRIIVGQALKFKQFRDADAGMLAISSKSEEALRRIAKECDINRERIKAYGVTLDEDTEKLLTDNDIAL